jgi:hypothetical protein
VVLVAEISGGCGGGGWEGIIGAKCCFGKVKNIIFKCDKIIKKYIYIE